MTHNNLDPDVLASIRQQIADMQQVIAREPAGSGLVPLEIKCTMTSCRHGRHCLDYLRRPYPGEQRPAPGECRDCGSAVTQFPSASDRNFDGDELVSTCASLQSELIRAHYWRVPIDRWAYNQALRKGSIVLMEQVATRVTRAMDPTNIYGGRGAAYSRDIVAYAQHATATCCRRCAAYWHGTPRDSETALSVAQLAHVTSAAKAFIAIRLPDLNPEPVERIPGITQRELARARENLSGHDDEVFGALTDGVDPAGFLVLDSSEVSVSGTRRRLMVERRIPAAG